jgi:hypothetical protein
LNNDDWGFGYFQLDDASIRVFEDRLANVENNLNRVVIIGQLISMVRQIHYPVTRLTYVLDQLIDEKNQNLINAVWTALFQARASFLPQERVQKFNYDVAQFFFKKAKKEKDDKSLSMFCIDKAMQFMTEKEHLSFASEWIYSEKIVIDHEELTCPLTD